eukprot:NODE_3762_length_1165_cov_104.401152_g3577_i0.p1 GENE.NODE_3762_length_1165_cov_104.401152_g3577_i0~~NODE_3762_length_1165_cov_104.401152_g3577_i0.p1  ORF type:complete len:331 (+),score=102.32 NODE_3762_length_1165_cov_104.401152_g3577_i0:69-995(+)
MAASKSLIAELVLVAAALAIVVFMLAGDAANDVFTAKMDASMKWTKFKASQTNGTATNGTCASLVYVCATSGNVRVAANDNVACPNGTCTDALCCAAGTMCNSYTCSSGTTLISNAASTTCANTGCTNALCCTSVSPSPSPASTVTSSSDMIVTLARTCDGTYTAANFVADVKSTTGVDVKVIVWECGSIICKYQCLSTTVANANSNCATVQQQLVTPGSAVNTKVGGVVAPSSSSSNKALYGLFGLFGLPLLLILAGVAFCLLKGKKGEHIDDMETETMTAPAFPGEYPAAYPAAPVYKAPVPSPAY